jgi:glycosyltransferase involved in cell wall biosynthesis
MNRGGAELRTLDLFRHLDPADYRFEFCALSGLPGELDGEIRSLGGDVHLMKLDLAFPVKFRRLLRTREFSAVHSHVHYFSGALLRLAAGFGIRQRIAHFRSTSDGKGSAWHRSLRNSLLKRWINEYATNILSVSDAAMDAAVGPDWRMDSRCQVIYSGIESGPEGLERDQGAVRREFALPAGAVLVTHVGRMDVEKNHPRLIRVFSRFARHMAQAYLLLVGSPKEPVFSELKRLARDLGVEARVIACGTRTDVRRLLLASDLMIFPSTREGMPGVVLEAAAVGTPILTSDIQPMIEVSRYLPIKTMSLLYSDEDWSSASVDLVHDPTLRTRMIRAFDASPFNMPASVLAFRRAYESGRMGDGNG